MEANCKWENGGMCEHPDILAMPYANKKCFKDKPCSIREAVPEGKDMVDRPQHYSRYGMETIDALRGTMSPEEFNGFLKGNAFKYLTRAGAKDDLVQDLHKIVWYVLFLFLTNGGKVDELVKTVEYMKERFSRSCTWTGTSPSRG